MGLITIILGSLFLVGPIKIMYYLGFISGILICFPIAFAILILTVKDKHKIQKPYVINLGLGIWAFISIIINWGTINILSVSIVANTIFIIATIYSIIKDINKPIFILVLITNTMICINMGILYFNIQSSNALTMLIIHVLMRSTSSYQTYRGMKLNFIRQFN